jgi:hypothetical protein
MHSHSLAMRLPISRSAAVCCGLALLCWTASAVSADVRVSKWYSNYDCPVSPAPDVDYAEAMVNGACLPAVGGAPGYYLISCDATYRYHTHYSDASCLTAPIQVRRYHIGFCYLAGTGSEKYSCDSVTTFDTSIYANWNSVTTWTTNVTKTASPSYPSCPFNPSVYIVDNIVSSPLTCSTKSVGFGYPVSMNQSCFGGFTSQYWHNGSTCTGTFQSVLLYLTDVSCDTLNSDATTDCNGAVPYTQLPQPKTGWQVCNSSFGDRALSLAEQNTCVWDEWHNAFMTLTCPGDGTMTFNSYDQTDDTCSGATTASRTQVADAQSCIGGYIFSCDWSASLIAAGASSSTGGGGMISSSSSTGGGSATASGSSTGSTGGASSGSGGPTSSSSSSSSGLGFEPGSASTLQVSSALLLCATIVALLFTQ